ncbi:MAG: hypothetical protein IT376_04015 [Polyangiaceae bacterium]|nr:hypothetical protein [Polyangiaceae bacterium]
MSWPRWLAGRASPPAAVSPRRRLVGSALIVGGVVLALGLVSPLFPRQQRLELRFDPPPTGSTLLTLSLQRDGEREACAGAELRVGAGQRRLEHLIELPSGAYRVEATLWPSAPGDAPLAARRAAVELDGEVVVVPLRIEP